jgi:Phytanoyl-CoA dioxygenase (PhyH)
MSKMFRWLMLPIHAAGILSGAKSFGDNHVIGSPALNRLGLHLWRREFARRMAIRRRQQLASAIQAEDRNGFERDGFLVKRDYLDPGAFESLRAEIMRLEADAREAIIGDTLTRLIPLDAPNLRRLPTVRGVLESEGFLGLIHYIGSFRRKPHLFVQTVYSQVIQNAPPDVQSFYHVDTFHPTVKAWYFLEGVGEDAAPFTYVPGSHKANRRRSAWERKMSVGAQTSPDILTREGSLRISDADLSRLNYRKPVKLAVMANTLIIADTSGFHKRAISAGQARRISIWAYSRSNPFLPWAGGDLAALPLIRGRVVRVFWFIQDRIARMTGGSGVWRWVGSRMPDTPPILAPHGADYQLHEPMSANRSSSPVAQ